MEFNQDVFNSRKDVFTQILRGSKERGPDRGTEYTVILRLINNDGKVNTYYFKKFEFRGNVLYNYNYGKGNKFFTALEKCYSILKGINRKYSDRYKISTFSMVTIYANQEEQTRIQEILGSSQIEYEIKFISDVDFGNESFKLRDKILDDEAAKFLRNSYLIKRGETDTGVSSSEGSARRKSTDKKTTRRKSEENKGKSKRSPPPEPIHKFMSKKISPRKNKSKR